MHSETNFVVEANEIDSVVLSDHAKDLNWKSRRAKLIEKAGADVIEQCCLRISALNPPAEATSYYLIVDDDDSLTFIRKSDNLPDAIEALKICTNSTDRMLNEAERSYR